MIAAAIRPAPTTIETDFAMAVSATKLEITKLDVAQRQLRTALRLWFSDGDPVSIHTLLSAAHEIIHRLYRNKGLVNLMFDSDLIVDGQRGSFAKKIKESANFFKHANRDNELDSTSSFNLEMNDVLPLFLIQGLRDMDENLGLEELVYIHWLSLHNPDSFQSGGSIFPIDVVEKLVGVGKKEFFDACQLLWSQGRLRNFLGPRPPGLKGG